MDYIPIQPGRRREPRALILAGALEILLAAPAAWVALTRVPMSTMPDHRQAIQALAGDTLPLALIVFPVLAWMAFHRRVDGAVWPLMWSPALWAALIVAAA